MEAETQLDVKLSDLESFGSTLSIDSSPMRRKLQWQALSMKPGKQSQPET
jgi:hypothetical protein